MTVTAFTSVSLDPLLVLFCAEKIARFHDAVLAAGTWAVSVLDEESEKTAALAGHPRPAAGRPAGRDPRITPGPVTGAPILDDALAAMECRTTAVHDGGDHSIVVGEVVGVSEPRGPAGRCSTTAAGYRTLPATGRDGPAGRGGPLTAGPIRG